MNIAEIDYINEYIEQIISSTDLIVLVVESNYDEQKRNHLIEILTENLIEQIMDISQYVNDEERRMNNIYNDETNKRD